MSGRKLFKESQVTDKIVEWIFMQFTLNLSQVTPTLEIITCRVLKTQEWIQGDVYEWKKVI